MSKLIELPLTGLRVKLSDGVDYHNDGAVDMGSHPQDLCERYRVKSALQELSPSPLLPYWTNDIIQPKQEDALDSIMVAD